MKERPQARSDSVDVGISFQEYRRLAGVVRGRTFDRCAKPGETMRLDAAPAAHGKGKSDFPDALN
ncbi:hypothetical protein, partial [Stenotrophomonas maltophilia]|uniref:hypothetical protein n=1 Tax=Stenotrophomonas maltophilia TaxID=40324 RepID=UPI001953AD70